MNKREQENTRLRMTRMKFLPKTRCDRRRAARETKEIVSLLLPIEMAFNQEVLTNDSAYKESYDYYLTKWQAALDRIRHMDFKIVVPAADYFAQQYRPQESN